MGTTRNAFETFATGMNVQFVYYRLPYTVTAFRTVKTPQQYMNTS